MPVLTPSSLEDFRVLREQKQRAIQRVSQARVQAVAAGQINEALALTQRREELRDEAVGLWHAEEAYIRSTMSVAEAEAMLAAETKRARDFVNSMAGVAETLGRATDLLGLFTRLIALA